MIRDVHFRLINLDEIRNGLQPHQSIHPNSYYVGFVRPSYASDYYPGVPIIGDKGLDRSNFNPRQLYRPDRRRPVTYTSVLVTVTTSTSTPLCSTTGTLPQWWAQLTPHNIKWKTDTRTHLSIYFEWISIVLFIILLYLVLILFLI